MSRAQLSMAGFAAALLALSVFSGNVRGSILTLDVDGKSGMLQGAIFKAQSEQPTGTGVFSPFVRIQGPSNGAIERGYNTDGTIEFETKDENSWTYSFTLGDLQTNKVEVDGVQYYEFVLDIGEPSGGTKPLLSLYELEIYTDDVSDNDDYLGPGSLGTKVYDLDVGADGDSTIELDYDLYGGGNGQSDMIALIPATPFGTDLTKYVYLYSAFGDPNLAEGSFEEWSRKSEGTFTPPPPPPEPQDVVPEPFTLFVWSGLFGTLGVSVSRRRRI